MESMTEVLAETETISTANDQERKTVVRILCASSFLIFFQAYMIGPLVPTLSVALHVSAQTSALLVPAYVLPYGLSTLFYGILSDRVGRRGVMMTLIAGMPVVIAITAFAQTAFQLMIFRILAGVCTGGIAPMGLALIGDVYPYRQRGRPLGAIFAAIAGGMAFGSTVAALIEPFISWRETFLIVALLSLGVLIWMLPHQRLLSAGEKLRSISLSSVLTGYRSLLSTSIGRRAYGYVFLNGLFHSGVFTYLGLYFDRVDHLTEPQIGIALLGYGFPGLFLGPAIGHAADRWGRRWIITAGLLLAAGVTALLGFHLRVWMAAVVVTILSFGFDMSHPLLAGIISNLDPSRRGQAMGLNAFTLFTGFGLGSLVFAFALRGGFSFAFFSFAGVLAIAGLAVPSLFVRRAVP
jgi:predicted MFS family arabinose efflux permease